MEGVMNCVYLDCLVFFFLQMCFSFNIKWTYFMKLPPDADEACLFHALASFLIYLFVLWLLEACIGIFVVAPAPPWLTQEILCFIGRFSLCTGYLLVLSLAISGWQLVTVKVHRLSCSKLWFKNQTSCHTHNIFQATIYLRSTIPIRLVLDITSTVCSQNIVRMWGQFWSPKTMITMSSIGIFFQQSWVWWLIVCV